MRSPAAVGKSPAIEGWQVVTAALERAVDRQPRDIPTRSRELRPEESHVETRVVRGDREVADSSRDLWGNVSKIRRIRDVGIRDPVNVGCSDRRFGVEARHPFGDQASVSINVHDSELDDAVTVRREPGRLNIDHHESCRGGRGLG